MSTAPRLFALVPCAGVGARAGADGPKQYVQIGGRAMVAHTLDALAAVPRLAATLVVLAPEDAQFESTVPGFAGGGAWVARCGGASRAATVANGLAVLRQRGVQDEDWVLVHDAARCLVQPEWIDRLIDECQGDAVGGLLAMPVADTLKRARDGRAEATVERSDKWAAQTPQMFRLALLERALREAGEKVTDEASAVEALGLEPKLVLGDAHNLKLTWPADFALATALLAQRAAPRPVIKAFVPSHDYALSLRFYAAIGFEPAPISDGMALLSYEGASFLLQDFQHEGLNENFVMSLMLADVDAFWRSLDVPALSAEFGARFEPPEDRAWGLRDMTIIDPGGVLWRVAAFAPSSAKPDSKTEGTR